MQVRTRDGIAEMFLKRIAMIHKQAREKLLEIQARQRKKTGNLVAALAGVLDAVRMEAPDSRKMQRIEQVFSEKGGAELLREDCEAVQAWSNNSYFPPLTRPFQRYRHVLAHSDDVDQSFQSDADQIGAKRRRPLSV